MINRSFLKLCGSAIALKEIFYKFLCDGLLFDKLSSDSFCQWLNQLYIPQL
ncbi:MAG: hypothetical protein ACOC04_03720 [Halothece sp.]